MNEENDYKRYMHTREVLNLFDSWTDSRLNIFFYRAINEIFTDWFDKTGIYNVCLNEILGFFNVWIIC